MCEREETIGLGAIEVAGGLDESSFHEEAGVEWVEETGGDEEVEIANIIDKSLKKFKWKRGRSKVGKSLAVCLLGARAGKRVCVGEA